MQSFDYGPSFLRFIILLISGRLFVVACIRNFFQVLLLIIHQTVHHIIVSFCTRFSASFISAVLVEFLVMFQTDFLIYLPSTTPPIGTFIIHLPVIWQDQHFMDGWWQNEEIISKKFPHAIHEFRIKDHTGSINSVCIRNNKECRHLAWLLQCF